MTETEQPDAYLEVFKRTGGYDLDRRSRAQQVAMVELVAVELRYGDRKPGAYLERPEHLPEFEEEMKLLLMEPSKKDLPLRADLIQWAHLNRGVAAENGFHAKNPIIAYQDASKLIDSSTNEEEKRHLLRWQKEIAQYLTTHFQINPDDAPASRTVLEAWCLKMALRTNPTPDWVVTKNPPPRGKRSWGPTPIGEIESPQGQGELDVDES
jgi:hypothetical protein